MQSVPHPQLIHQQLIEDLDALKLALPQAELLPPRTPESFNAVTQMVTETAVGLDRKSKFLAIVVPRIAPPVAYSKKAEVWDGIFWPRRMPVACRASRWWYWRRCVR